MPIDKNVLQYVGAYVSTDSAVVPVVTSSRIPGNLNWIDSNDFPVYEGVSSNSVMLEFRTAILDRVLQEFRELEPVSTDAQGQRSVVIEYDGVPIRIEEAPPATIENTSYYSYHSFWIPRSEHHESDVRLDDAKMHVNNRPNPFGLGWVRYDLDAPYDKVIRALPHVALKVVNVEFAVDGYKVLIPPKQTQPGLRIAFVECGGLPVEFVEIDPVIHPNGI